MHIIEGFLIPIVRSMKAFSVEEVNTRFKRIRGHNMAKACVENALLDLMAKTMEIPLFQLIGGESKRIMSGISIGIQDDVDALLDSIGKAVEKKYHRIKIKIKKGKDVEIIRAIRDAFPDIRLMADANADYTLEDIDRLKALDAFGLMMVEQPLNYDDIYLHSFVQKQIRTPICLDESIKGMNDARTAVDLGSCQIINIKQGRVGGMLEAKAIQAFCMEHDIQVWSGGMLETGIGRAFNIHLQTLPGFVLPGDTSETVRYFKEDIVDQPVGLESDGFIRIPEGTGIGVRVIPERLDRFSIFHKEV